MKFPPKVSRTQRDSQISQHSPTPLLWHPPSCKQRPGQPFTLGDLPSPLTGKEVSIGQAQPTNTTSSKTPRALPPRTKCTAPSLIGVKPFSPAARASVQECCSLPWQHHSSTERLQPSRGAQQAAGEMVYLISLLQTRQGCLFICFNLPKASKM